MIPQITVTDDEEDKADMSQTDTPSFDGRLKLNQFLYTKSENLSSFVRRSPRLNASSSTTPSPSSYPSKATLSSPRQSTKRKLETQTTLTTATSKPQKSSSSPQKRNRKSSSYAPPATYAHLPPLQDILAPDLLIIFVGLNPGIQTARSGHAYAHPSNLFWKLLYSSGITPVPCKAEEDRTLPDRFSLGNTNIVSRPSRNGAELSKAEMDEGVQVLEEKIRQSKPEVVCVVGKSIWESIWRVKKGRAITKAEFSYGWQGEGDNMGLPHEVKDSGREKTSQSYGGAKVFVATSTSGLAASLRPEEKQKIWNELGDWCKSRRQERKETEWGSDV